MFANPVIQCPFLERLEKDKRRISRDGGATVVKKQRVRGVQEASIDSSDDVIYEVMKHMDAKSLAIAACVSTKWRKVAEDETLWENVCIQHWSSPVAAQRQLRSVVLALGGFRRLYVQCLRPFSGRGRRVPQPLPSSLSGQANVDREWTKDEVHLSLSLFSIDCYERLGRRQLSSSSLKLLCKPSANLSLGGRHHMLALPKAEANVR
ncbi:unnamed protein product [Calypogeia fissa]